MAYGAVDLRPGAPADGFLAEFGRALIAEPEARDPVAVWVNTHGERLRVTVSANRANTWLCPVLARASTVVDRAVVGLDHDEYGVEHVVFDGSGGILVRVHHVYVYPHNEPDPEIVPTAASLPGRADLAARPDGTLSGVDALAAAAALYDVGAERMVQAVRSTAKAHESLQIVFEPLAPWWAALGVTYPVPALGEPTTVLPPNP